VTIKTETRVVASTRPDYAAAVPARVYLALIFSVAATASSAIFVRWADAPGSVFGLYRMVVAITIFAIPAAPQARRNVTASPRQLWLSIFAGLFLALSQWVWNTAALVTSAATATLFGNTSVFWVALGSVVFFHEKLRAVFWGGLLLALAGVTIIIGQDFLSHPTIGISDVMAILGGFFYGAFLLATARVREQMNAFISWWLSSLMCAIALLSITLALHLPIFGYPLQTYLSVLGAGLLIQVGGYLAVSYVLGFMRASTVSPTLLAQPVFAAIFALLLLGQPITVSQIIGGTLMLVGIFIIHRTNQNR
jgi:drug/metabolite transporter (DMT)-like permease